MQTSVVAQLGWNETDGPRARDRAPHGADRGQHLDLGPARSTAGGG